MNKSKNKDKLLNDIRNNSFDYNAGSHATMIADFERDGLVIVSRTKDGVDCDITEMGDSFLCDGGYVAIAKKEKKKKVLKWTVEAITAIAIGVIVSLIVALK